MPSNTALSYQMMIEEKLMSAMINSEQRGMFPFACSYARTYCTFLSIDADKIPEVSISLTTEADKQIAYINNYFSLLNLIAKTASDKIAEVRRTYGKKSGDLLQ